MQRGLYALAQFFIFTGHHRGRQGVLGDLTGQIRPGKHTDTRLRSNFLEDFTHQHEGVRLNAFGQAHQELATQSLGMGRQYRTQGAGRQCDETQFTIVEGGLQISDRLHGRMHLDTLEVAWILAVDSNGLGLLGITHPLAHCMTVFSQQVCHGGTKTPAPRTAIGRCSVIFNPLIHCSGDGSIIRGGRASTSPRTITDTRRKLDSKTKENADIVTGKVDQLG